MKLLFNFRKFIGILYVLAIISLCVSGCQGSSNKVEEIELPEEKTESQTETAFVPINTEAPSYCPEASTLADARGVSLTTFSTRNFVGSGQCATCHQNLVDNNGNDVSITSDWRSAMMANAAKDPLWQAKVSSEIARNPDLQEVIEDKCATCHMPMARTQAITSNTSVGIIDGGFLDTSNNLNVAAMDGVSCTLCHQIRNQSLGDHASFSGKYKIDTTVVSPDRLIFGPFPNPQQTQMRNRVGFVPVMGEQTKDSGLCATCHTLYTPYLNSQGEVAGEFPEQTPYLEWESSQYGDGEGDDKACQDCHMPAADSPVVISTMPGRLLAREPFAKHYFIGGNRFMLEIMKANSSELNLTAATSHLDITIARTRSQLSNNTASISLISAQKQGETLALQVLISNRAGHKLPTGFPSRRVWIHITVNDASGQVLFESGKPANDGSIIGNDADFDAAKFEPHYDTITSDEQVQIYEAIMRDTDERVTYTLLRAAAYVKDNRMLPEGFDASNVTEDIAVYGNASGDDNFQNGEDKVEYLIPVTNSKGPFKVTLSLLYQPASFRFLDDLVDNDTNEIKRFASFLDQACKMPEVISFSAYQIP